MKPRACMLAYTFYESDNRVRRYAETLVKEGYEVDAIALRVKGAEKYSELKGVNIYKIQERVINEKGKLDYLFRLLKFFIKSFFFLAWQHIKRPYKLIHVHSVPDFEVFASLIPKLFGCKIILDIHDIVPEFYCSKFKVCEESFLFKCLVFIEKISCWFSNHVIISNHLWYDKIIQRSVSPEKCTTIINYPDTSIFYKRDNLKKNNEKFIMMYPGSLNWHQGLDIAINALSRIKDQAPNAELYIYGNGPARPGLEAMVTELELTGRVYIKDGMSIDKIAEIMANADVGVVPKRNDPFGGEAFSTKTLEFMSLGVPIILSKTRIDEFYFNASVVRFFKSEDESELAAAMLELYINKNAIENLAENSLKFANSYSWDLNKDNYLNIVNRLIYKQ